MPSEKIDTKPRVGQVMVNLGNDRSGRPMIVEKKWLEGFVADWQSETEKGFEGLFGTKKTK